MTPRERVEAALRGEQADRVPFTAYEDKLPARRRTGCRRGALRGGAASARLHVDKPNTSRRRVAYSEGGIDYVRTEVHTPVGDLSWVERTTADAEVTWLAEYPFKGPGDYEAIEFMVQDQAFAPAAEAVRKAQGELGEGDSCWLTSGTLPFRKSSIPLWG